MNLWKLLCCYWCYSIPDLINVSHVRRETHSQLHSKHLKYGFKLREAKKVKYSAGMKKTLMNDGSNAVSLCEAAAICQTLFHVLFTRFIFIYLWHRHSSLMCSEYDVYGISAAHFWRRAWVGSFPALGHCLPFGRAHKSALNGISRELGQVVQSRTWQIRLSSAASHLSLSGGLWGCHPSEGSPSCGCSHRSWGSRWRAVASGGCLTDAGSARKGTFARCDVAASSPGVWRLRGLARGLTQTKPARQAEHAPSNIIRLVTAVCVTLNPGTKWRLYSAHT